VVKYAIRFNKILKKVNYNENYIHKMKVRKFINSLTDRLVELTQIQSPANLDNTITATILLEMGIKRRNGWRNNVYMIEIIEALRNQVKVLQTEV